MSVMDELPSAILYCIIADFINSLNKTTEDKNLLETWKAKRKPKSLLMLSEVLTIVVYFLPNITTALLHFKSASTIHSHNHGNTKCCSLSLY